MAKKKPNSNSNGRPSTKKSEPDRNRPIDASNHGGVSVKSDKKLNRRSGLQRYGVIMFLVGTVVLSGSIYCHLDCVKSSLDSVLLKTLGPEFHTALHSTFLSVQAAVRNTISTATGPPTNEANNNVKSVDPSAADSSQTNEKPHTSDDDSPTMKSTSASKEATYIKADVTNAADMLIRTDLDTADTALDKGDLKTAMSLFDNILQQHPRSPRAAFGKVRTLCALAEQQRSNTVLEQAISECVKILDFPDIPQSLFIKAGMLCADRQSFRGFRMKAVKTLRVVAERYPTELSVWNDLGVKYLISDQIEEARNAFMKVLELDKQNGYAMAHLGFIVKTTDHNYTGSIPLLLGGINSGDPAAIDGRFFMQLGDALYRVGREEEAYEIYKQGAEHGVFLSMWQRSLYNVDRLKSHPWWTPEETRSAEHFRRLESHWKEIRDEGLANLNADGVFEPEAEDLSDYGDWKQLTLYARGRQNAANCKRAPVTCKLVKSFIEATSCTRGQIKFSVMHPVVHVWPHCGPSNCRVRAHLGLVIPSGPRIRVTNETRTWTEGKFLIFDDSFEHEVWHDGDSLRLILIVDIWHPDLTQQDKATLSPI